MKVAGIDPKLFEVESLGGTSCPGNGRKTTRNDERHAKNMGKPRGNVAKYGKARVIGKSLGN